MATHVRLDTPHASVARRVTIGVLVSSDCRRLAAVLASSAGRGVDAQVDVGRALTYRIPDETAMLFDRLAGHETRSADSAAVGLIAKLRTHLAKLEALVVRDSMAEAGVAPCDVLAVGVHDPGLWSLAADAPRGHVGLCDPARLAELTGLNVIDAFCSRDVASGGLGGPLTPIAEWMLLKSPTRDHVLLDLGRSVLMTYLPKDSGPGAISRILAFEVGPGMGLLDLLTLRLTNGKHGFDSGGRLAVQGHRIPELVEHWLADPFLSCGLPRWYPGGVPAESFLEDSMRMAVHSSWSVRDMLCSATHFIAEAIALTFREHVPADAAVQEVLLAGGGQHNGMLLREIGARLPGTNMVRIGAFGIAGDALGPACVALLALLHLDRVPANLPAVTGTEISRVLGRLTPGTPQNWQRLIQRLAGSKPSVRPLLRSAL